MPTPPVRARQIPIRQGSVEARGQPSERDPVSQPHRQLQDRPPPRQISSDSQRQPTMGSRRLVPAPRYLPQSSNEMGDEIRQLLGEPAKPAPSLHQPMSDPKVENEFQADWLSHPNPAIPVPQSADTGSVYIPVSLPKDRPTIPKGGLAPAPPPKVKRSPVVASPAGSGTGANKWADRLRDRR